MTDRELLELAAKAAGRSIKWDGHVAVLLDFEPGVDDCSAWNPLKNDGDALRLAVKLNLLLLPYPDDNAVRVTRLDQPETIVSFGTPPDPYAATRLAIVRAAAEIGQSLGEGESKT
jgi:hypothetical protein